MTAQKIHYCFTLSEEQLKYLRSKKYKIDRMECFMSLVDLVGRDTKLVQISKTQQMEILRGQVMADNSQLAKLWDKDRKTVPKFLEAMEALGISSSQKVGENRIHTLHSLSGWYVDSHFVGNDYAIRRKSGTSTIIHADVPPARIITIENPDDKNKGGEVYPSGSNKSPNAIEGKNIAADAVVSQPTPQSNDSGSVGNSHSDVKTSDTSLNNISLPSDVINSSSIEVYDNMNGGKVKELSSEHQEDMSSHPDDSPSADYSSLQMVAGGNTLNGSNSDE